MLALLVLAAAPALHIESSLDGAAFKPGWVYARVGQRVVLRAVLAGGAKATGFTWLKLEPVDVSVDNTEPSFHFAPIHFVATEAARGETFVVDVRPSVFPAVEAAPGAGTMAYQVIATLEDGSTLSTPGLEAVKYGGLTPAVHRVTFRANDGYLGYVSELINTPYIFGSAGPDGRNQTDLLIGADCADLAVYGQRRLGKKAEYTSTYNIDKQAPEQAKAVTLGEDGRGLDAHGKPIAAKPGDVLHFPGSRHVAVLWEDRPPLGVLDAGDLMIHTCWAPPKIEPIGATDCASLPWRVLRFK
jgi:hypothetical protein